MLFALCLVGRSAYEGRGPCASLSHCAADADLSDSAPSLMARDAHTHHKKNTKGAILLSCHTASTHKASETMRTIPLPLFVVVHVPLPFLLATFQETHTRVCACESARRISRLLRKELRRKKTDSMPRYLHACIPAIHPSVSPPSPPPSPKHTRHKTGVDP